jgi:hypothetical protein
LGTEWCREAYLASNPRGDGNPGNNLGMMKPTLEIQTQGEA